MTTTVSPGKREILDKAISEILIDFALGHQDMPELSFAPFEDATWDRFSLRGLSGKIATFGSALRLLVAVPRGPIVAEFHKMMDLLNRPLALTLRDGSAISAKLANMQSLAEAADIRLYNWEWTSNGSPFVWVGKLWGKMPHGGNLTLHERKNDVSSVWHDGFGFRGKYAWYIVPSNDLDFRFVIIDPRDQALGRETLIDEFNALHFVLGSRLRLDYVAALDRSRNVVGAMSVGGFERQQPGGRPPVPNWLGEAEIWQPEFFRRVALKIGEDGMEPLIIAIAAYLDSVSDHLDGAYLKAQVGLEAFAKRIIGESSPDLLVKDGEAWKEWISSLVPLIQSHVMGPQQSDSSRQLETIRNKFVAAMYAPSGDTVRKAFQMHGIEIPKYVREEIKKRNYPAHGFFMNKTSQHEYEDFRRLELVQTLIAALVAANVGYEGPIRGYDVADNGGRVSPSWWPVRCRPEDVSIHYWAERFLGAPESEDVL